MSRTTASLNPPRRNIVRAIGVAALTAGVVGWRNRRQVKRAADFAGFAAYMMASSGSWPSRELLTYIYRATNDSITADLADTAEAEEGAPRGRVTSCAVTSQPSQRHVHARN